EPAEGLDERELAVWHRLAAAVDLVKSYGAADREGFLNMVRLQAKLERAYAGETLSVDRNGHSVPASLSDIIGMTRLLATLFQSFHIDPSSRDRLPPPATPAPTDTADDPDALKPLQ